MSGVTKAMLKDPLGGVRTALGGLDDPAARDAATRRALTLAPLAEELRELGSVRKRTSREIGAAKARAADTSALLATMRDAGARAAALETELRAGLEAILAALPAPVAKADEARADASREIGRPDYFGTATRTAPGGADGSAPPSVRHDFDADDYTRYVRAHPARTSYHELALRELIAATLGQRGHYLLARDADGSVCGVLPLVRLRSRLFGDYVVSMPWFNYGGPLADDARASEALVRAAAGFAREAGCSHVEIRETGAREGWVSRTHKVSMTLALPDTVAAFERALGASLRAQSSRALRAGCTFEVGGRELLDDFYRVFSINMRDLGTPVQGRAFFDGLLELFGDGAFLAVVRHGSTPLAAGFLLAHGSTLEIPWASSLRRANPLSVNMLLYRRTLEEAIGRGYRFFDFGRSSPDGATWRFKRQWGAVPQPLHWHYWTRDGQAPGGLSPDNPKYRAAIVAWQHLPVPLTRLLGPRIVRGLP